MPSLPDSPASVTPAIADCCHVREALQIYRHHFDKLDTVAKGDDEILLF
jgi:hypothetical protein